MDITELDKNFAAAKVGRDGKNVLRFRARRLSFTAECMKRGRFCPYAAENSGERFRRGTFSFDERRGASPEFHDEFENFAAVCARKLFLSHATYGIDGKYGVCVVFARGDGK